MYEDFFALNRRPFSNVPHADDYVEIAPHQDALDSLVHCVTQSRGIAVVTSEPGLGKTMLCKRLAKLLEVNHRSVFLSAAGLETRIGLLQAILFELNVEYVGLSDQEAHLKLLEVARQMHSDRRRLLLILDEANLITTRLFEELRALTEYAPDGENLIQAVLCGSFELEEKLTDPAMSTFNQRIGEQLCLSPLSITDSARFLSQRFQACGADDIFSIITEEALELICHASDGNLRCLTQLTDHACLLAFAEECRPVNKPMIRAALNDLKELPLRWNEIPDDELSEVDTPACDGDEPTEPETAPQEDASATPKPPISPAELETDEFLIPEFLKRDQSEETAAADIADIDADADENMMIEGHLLQAEASAQAAAIQEPEFAVFEIGPEAQEESSIDHSQASAAENEERPLTEAETSSEQEPETFDSAEIYEFPQTTIGTCPQMEEASEMQESPVIDRYTLLDRFYELPEDRRSSVDLSLLEHVEVPLSASASLPNPDCASQAEDVLELVQQIRQDIRQNLEPIARPTSIDPKLQPENIRPDDGESISPKSTTTDESITTEEDSEVGSERKFEQLFTRLRMRRRKIEADHQSRKIV